MDNINTAAAELNDIIMSVYIGDADEDRTLPYVVELFNQILPHFASLEPRNRSLFVSASRWLDRACDIPAYDGDWIDSPIKTR